MSTMPTQTMAENLLEKIMDWAEEVQERGAGEILLTSVDRDGTGEGFDLDLIKKVSKN